MTKLESASTEFRRGLLRPLEGWRFVLARHRLASLALVGGSIMAAFTAAGLVFALTVVGPRLAALFPTPSSPGLLGAFLRGVAFLWLPVSYLLALFVTGTVFAALGRAVAEPMFDQLSQGVDEEAGGSAPPAPAGFVEVTLDALRGLLHLAAGGVVVLSSSCALLTLHVVPLVGSAASTLGSLAVTAFFLALEALDYPLARRRFRYVDQLRWAADRFWQAVGFGMVVSVSLMVPGGVLFVLPAAVAGATLWVVEEERQESA